MAKLHWALLVYGMANLMLVACAANGRASLPGFGSLTDREMSSLRGGTYPSTGRRCFVTSGCAGGETDVECSEHDSYCVGHGGDIEFPCDWSYEFLYPEECTTTFSQYDTHCRTDVDKRVICYTERECSCWPVEGGLECMVASNPNPWHECVSITLDETSCAFTACPPGW